MTDEQCKISIVCTPQYNPGQAGTLGPGLVRADFRISSDPSHVTIDGIELRIVTHPDNDPTTLARLTIGKLPIKDEEFNVALTAIIPEDYDSDEVNCWIEIDYSCDGQKKTPIRVDTEYEVRENA